MAIQDKVTLAKALESGEVSQVELAMTQFAQETQEAILDKTKDLIGNQEALAQASGIKLTGEERQYFMELIGEDGKHVSENAVKTVPTTIVNRVFDGLAKEHKLLGMVDQAMVGLSTEWIFSIGVNPAQWGTICSDLKEILDKGFRKVSLGLFKLTAFMPVCKGLLDLNSPEWLAQYVITVIQESLAIAIEMAIIDGTGKEQPIGMRRSIKNKTSDEATVLEATEIEKLDAQTSGNIMASLVEYEVETGVKKTRNVNPSDVVILVNPVTYWTKVFPMMTLQNLNGVYVQSLPLQFEIVQSEVVPQDELIVGVAKDYFFGIGKGTVLSQSDEVRFIQDERVYAGKFYGNGTPKFEGAFKRFTFKAPAVK
jgi:hypothetical protein